MFSCYYLSSNLPFSTCYLILKMLNLPPSRFHISTFATKLGVRNIAFLGSGLLILNYIGAVVAAIYMPQVGIAPIFSLMYSFCLSFFVNSHYMLLRLLDVA